MPRRTSLLARLTRRFMKPPPDTELTRLDARVNALLPARYQHCYTAVRPDSMGSAGLKYGPDGRIAWDRIWTTFCDLALAGGPPHRGSLLEPVPEHEVTAEPDRYREVVAEIGRGVGLAAGLPVVGEVAPGWVGVRCESPAAAAWLRLAVVAENVSARWRGDVLHLPAGPRFRVEKEIKNVVVATAKACHYWDGHLSPAQQALAAELTWNPADPTDDGYPAAVDALASAIGTPVVADRYAGWVGVDCGDDETAVWLLRAVLADRVLARREGATLFLPVCTAPGVGDRVARAFADARRLWQVRHPRA